jgi:hypothetical protein
MGIMNGRIADRGIMTHLAELGPLNALLLDLKKQKLGYAFEAITDERLEECSKAVAKIMQCRKPGLMR